MDFLLPPKTRLTGNRFVKFFFHLERIDCYNRAAGDHRYTVEERNVIELIIILFLFIFDRFLEQRDTLIETEPFLD